MDSTTVHFGNEWSVPLELPRGSLVADCGTPRATPLPDAVSAVSRSLAEPLSYPPLVRATVPGDRIVLAIDHGVPQVDQLITGIVQTLVGGGTNPHAITVIQPQNGSNGGSASVGSTDLQGAVRRVTHDPTDRVTLRYLAASRDARPIYFNRHICDADVLVPVGCLRPEGSPGYLGTASGLFPTFADAGTQRRFRAPIAVRSPARIQKLQQEADEAAWLLGYRFTLQVVPGQGDSILHVLAGDVDAVVSRGRQLATLAWSCRVPRRASLVIAAISGGPQQQTWDNVGRSLAAAMRVVEDDGAVVVCSDLVDPPGASLLQVAQAHSLEAVEQVLNRERRGDTLPASQLVQALRRVKVYLMSRLDVDLVEDLGMGHISHPKQIRKLSHDYPTCIVLANSQHAVPFPENEDGAA